MLVPFKKLETLFALFKSVILDISSTLGRKTCLAIELYVEFDSDSIGRATRMVLEEDVNHRLKPHEVAKQVIAILNKEPVKPKRKATRRTPASKNICDYITDDN